MAHLSKAKIKLSILDLSNAWDRFYIGVNKTDMVVTHAKEIATDESILLGLYFIFMSSLEVIAMVCSVIGCVTPHWPRIIVKEIEESVYFNPHMAGKNFSEEAGSLPYFTLGNDFGMNICSNGRKIESGIAFLKPGSIFCNHRLLLT